jgi:myo-inositol-1(or 4)-monophosphatase
MTATVELAFVVETARRAAAILREGAGRSHRAASKRAATDLVTEYDRRSEAAIVAEIRAAHPDHHILAEEGGAVAGSEARARHRWLIDPLDGTTNFAHGLPFFCVSIALEIDGAIELGVVEAPALGWSFAAARGRGAALNDRPLHVSDVDGLDRALLATGFPYDRATNPRNNFAEFVTLQRRAQAVRRVGAAALDLCMVAAGWMDGYWEADLKPWDIAAGALIVTEAGGQVSGYDGTPLEVDQGEVIATNGRIHDAVIAALRTPDRHL